MAVNWLWKHKVGEVIMQSFDQESKKNITWKLEMFGGNMMCCFIYRYKMKNEKTNKMEKYYTFFIWFDDLNHAKRILKDDKDFFHNISALPSKCKKIRLCVTSKVYNYSNKEMLQLGKLLAEYGYKVELY